MAEPAGAAGQLPSGYEFIRLLGHGGGGSVVLARQIQLDRLVAIKTLHAGIADSAEVGRLKREGKAIAALEHHNVVRVFELIVDAAGVWLVMEHVPGGDLGHAISANRLTGAPMAGVLLDVGTALEHAHSRGIVHRDVKPGNVLLGADGGAKLADFGLARLGRSAATFRTLPGFVAGTPMYMSPEQITYPDLESPGMDAYAYAVLCFEVLTGARPFAATRPAAVIAAHLHEQPIPPWSIAPRLPGPVGQILLAGLAKRAADRPTPRQIADRIRAVPPADWDAFFRTPRAVHAPAGDVSVPAQDGPAPVGDLGPNRWIDPPVYRPPVSRRLGPATARLLGVLAGVIVGVVVGLILLRR